MASGSTLSNRTITPGISPFAWRIFTGIYFLATSFGHLEFSLWLVRNREYGTLSFAISEFVPYIATAAAITLLAWILRDVRHHPKRLVLILCWCLWAIGVGLIDRFLTFSINETAHYPQYALLAWLISKCMDPQRVYWPVGRIMFWTTLLGMADETMQYLWITRSYSDYLDFNDFLVNLVAGVAGVLVYFGNIHTLTPPRFVSKVPGTELVTISVLVFSLGFGVLSDRLQMTPVREVPPGGIAHATDGRLQVYLQRKAGFYGAYHQGVRRDQYWVLDPTSGLILLVIVGGVFTGTISRLQYLSGASERRPFHAR